MSFNHRAYKHDNEAIPFVMKSFAKHDFGCHILGIEIDNQETKQALMAQSDSTSIMLRYRPDRFFTRKGWRSVLCEVKSEYQGYSNFAIEFNSYIASKQWNIANKHVMYALVDLGKMSISCCWVDAMPFPTLVYVPKRYDFDQTWKRLRSEYPGLDLEEKEHRGGAGTAYFLVPKASPYLIEFNSFVTTELLPVYEPELKQPIVTKQPALFDEFYLEAAAHEHEHSYYND